MAEVIQGGTIETFYLSQIAPMHAGGLMQKMLNEEAMSQLNIKQVLGNRGNSCCLKSGKFKITVKKVKKEVVTHLKVTGR